MPNNHRHCYLLSGSPDKVLSDFLFLSQNLASPLVVAQDISHYEGDSHRFSTCAFKQVRQHLGRTHDAILLDLTQGVSASALAILAGTVRGEGLFAIALPEQDWLTTTDHDLARYLPWPLEPEQVTSYFKHYLNDCLHRSDSPFQPITSSTLTPLPALTSTDARAPLTTEQAHAQSALLMADAGAYVLIAPRGRGKSTLLGDTLATLIQAGKRVAITAPNQEAITTLKQRFSHLMTASQTKAELPFFAPDALEHSTNHWDYLFVDEAAMLPLPMLKAMSKLADHTVFSTTDYGYEGAGKGFGLRFCRYLTEQKSPQQHALQRLTLDTPIRWGGNDPLEHWLNNTLFLTDENATPTALIWPEKRPSYHAFSTSDWLSQSKQLADTFRLLVSAHYQTSPDNLRWMLDDPSVTSYLATANHQLNCVAIVTEEGNLPDELSQAVMQGTRRPRGHLLPQSLLAHEGLKDAGRYRYWRISRIATNPERQQQGHASRLLDHIAQNAQSRCDFLCTSFAATPDVVAFWLKNGYRPIRLGTAKDQASGSYSLMMIKPLNEMAALLADQWQGHFIEQFSLNILLQYPDLATELIMLIMASSTHNIPPLATLSSQDRHDLTLFMSHHRPFDSLRPVLFKAALNMAQAQQLQPDNPMHRLFLEAALGRHTEASRHAAGLSGKKAMMSAIKQLLAEAF
ncbi:tRNA(Met) cytidine acetyltransferase [Marinomonas sp. A79]|uniref:tRNA(Met) cytidine acetyltransferase TmcA n=1 Tax=Marinomonas vulgaris TaxID=2823372 RepID=A0ABS5HCF2_9GAMM|nr:GNAT family N-acetyltransferase [Marinomonas vulgaris]MBR7889068.1 tRNA(Met) cytidine acetyltransferase [Marinomonas vulgaris]